MRPSLIALSVASVLLAGCPDNKTSNAAANASASGAAAVKSDSVAADKVVDEHSYAQPDKVQTQDVALDLAIDFSKKILSGTAVTWQNFSRIQRTLMKRSSGIWNCF